MTDGVARGIWRTIRRTCYSSSRKVSSGSGQRRDEGAQGQPSRDDGNDKSKELKDDIVKMRQLVKRKIVSQRVLCLSLLKEADGESDDSDSEQSPKFDDEGEYELSNAELKKKVLLRLQTKIQ